MKQIKKNLVMLVATMLIATSAWAGGEVTIIKKLNGTVNNSVGTVTSEVNATNGQCTVTVTPADDYYIKSVTAEKTVNGNLAQGRLFRAPNMDNMLEVTGPDEAYDPSKETSWTFTMPAADYDVEVVADFQTRTSIEGATVTLNLPAEGYSFDGEEKTPAVTSVVLDGKTLTVTTDYTVGYSDNIDAGTATVTVTGQGIYTGEATQTFTIDKAALGELSINIEGWTYGEYDEEINAPHVYNNSGEGDESIYYKVKDADDNTYTETVPTNAGTYTVKVEVAESDNYAAGSATADFTIAKADITPEVTIQNWTYGDTPDEPVVEGNPGNGAVTFTYQGDNDDEPTTTVPTNAGGYTIFVSVAETANYNAGETFREFSIEQADFSQVVIDDIADQTYTGSAITPDLTVTFKGNPVDASEYTVGYSNDHTDVGTVTITLTTTDKNFAQGETNPTKTFNIVAASVVVTAQNQTVTYNGTEQYFDNYESDDVEVDVQYYASAEDREADANQLEVALNAGTYYIKLVSGDENYTFEPVNVTFIIEPKNLNAEGIDLWSEIDEEGVIYTGEPIEFEDGMFGLMDIVNEDETDLTKDEDYTVVYSNNTNVGTATITLTGQGNYTGTLTIDFDIVRDLDITFDETRQWATYYAAENLQIPEGLKAFIVTGIGESEVIVEEITYIPQHVGVLLTYEEEIPEVCLAAAYDGATQEFEDNLLQGCSVATNVSTLATANNSIYVLYNNEFVKTTSGSIPAFRCYLEVNTGAEARLSIIVDDSNASGIDATFMNREERTMGIYDLQGRRVESSIFNSPLGSAACNKQESSILKKGIYIINGKKVVVK